jgi:hypothetical protein
MFIIAESEAKLRSINLSSGVILEPAQIAIDGRAMTGHGFSETDIVEGTSQGAVFCEVLPNTFVVPPTIQSTAEQEAKIESELTEAVRQYMNSEAAKLGYGSPQTEPIDSVCSYAAIPSVAKFQTEGLAFGNWRSLVWAKCYSIMADVKLGKRTIPTKEVLILELPKLVIPS